MDASLLVWLLNWVKMVERVEPLAHGQALANLHLNFLLAQRLQEHESNRSVEGSRVRPAGEKSGAHEGSEVAFLDVEQVGGGEDSAGEVSSLNDALSVVQSIDNGPVDLPVVVIHASLSLAPFY